MPSNTSKTTEVNAVSYVVAPPYCCRLRLLAQSESRVWAFLQLVCALSARDCRHLRRGELHVHGRAGLLLLLELSAAEFSSACSRCGWHDGPNLVHFVSIRLAHCSALASLFTALAEQNERSVRFAIVTSGHVPHGLRGRGEDHRLQGLSGSSLWSASLVLCLCERTVCCSCRCLFAARARGVLKDPCFAASLVCRSAAVPFLIHGPLYPACEQDVAAGDEDALMRAVTNRFCALR
jgi:hypothetical protein